MENIRELLMSRFGYCEQDTCVPWFTLTIKSVADAREKLSAISAPIVAPSDNHSKVSSADLNICSVLS